MNLQQHYLASRVNSSTPGELVVMLYDGLLRFAGAAEARLAAGGAQTEAAEAVARATNILGALTSSLDYAVDAALCTRLSALYAFFTEELHAALRERSPRRIRQVLPLVEELRQAWSQASRHVGAGAKRPAFAGA